ncbi:GDSL-type esterase/lipase family protein [Pedobacter jamesrossensis]|uniref:GDSL-type esterase/lipase family protein n=1 Tax=Pedobacter jamesrossensis TaxID=1908238 RepID=A0ABV8NPM7_9SPHI
MSCKGFGQVKDTLNAETEKIYPKGEIVSRYHNNWTQRYYPKRILAFKAEPLRFGEIVFLGNSITEAGADWTSKFGIAHIRNRGIAGDLTDGLLKRLGEIIYFKPKAVFILIGINDLFSLHHLEDNPALVYDKTVSSPAYVAKNILKIARKIHRGSPDTKIFVRTILPIRRQYLKADIILVNTIIKKNERKGYYKVIDFHAHFKDDNGELPQELTNDGVHLNDKGYAKWVSFEKAIIEGIRLAK